MAGGGTAFEGPGRAAPAGFRAPVTGVAGGCPRDRPAAAVPAALAKPENTPDRPPGLATGAGLPGRKGAPGAGQSLVTRLISVRLVIPCAALSRADWRRSLTPIFCAASAMSSALPPCSTMVAISSVIGITW